MMIEIIGVFGFVLPNPTGAEPVGRTSNAKPDDTCEASHLGT